MKQLCFILLIICAVLLAPLDTLANDGASAVDKADMIYVDESSNGLYQLYYQDNRWYVYHSLTGEYTDLGTTLFGNNYVFWGNYIGYVGIDSAISVNGIYDPQTGERVSIDFDNAAQYKPHENYGEENYDYTLSMAWHEASASFVRLNLVGINSNYGSVGSADLWLDFYDLDGNLKRSIETPFRHGFYRYFNEGIPEFNLLHMWGDYAVFYHFPIGLFGPEGENIEYITFYNINDGTYWFGNGEMFRAIKDRIIILDYDYDDYGNTALQAELYINGECADALWLPVDGQKSGNSIKYNYPENKLVFNNYYVFDFVHSIAYFESGEWDL